jgi:chemotaxis protein MotB
MILFILLYAISTVSEEKYDKLSTSLSNSMGEGAGIFTGSNSALEGGNDSIVDIGTGSGGNNTNGSSQSTVSPTEAAKAPEATNAPDEKRTPVETQEEQESGINSGSLTNEQDMTNLENDVDDILTEMDMDLSATTTVIESGLLISFANDAFFDSGQDVLKADMKKGLNQIAELLNKVDNKIIIEGHTDNIGISNSNKYNSNWQLSAARAANVAQYLVEKQKVDGERISAVGYGEYRPVASNDTKQGRSQNRRVDIIILYNRAIGLEYNK